jgi:hypothetical protein
MLYTLPADNSSTSAEVVSPLTWAITCGHVTGNVTGLTLGSNEWGIRQLLQGGANPLLFGPEKPAAALVKMPEEIRRCHQLGVCSAEEVRVGVRNLLLAGTETVTAGGGPAVYEQVWTAQEGNYIAQSGEWVKKNGSEPTGSERDVCEIADMFYQTEVKVEEVAGLDAKYSQAFPLHVAVANNELATVQQLLSSVKHDVNEKDDLGFTPLQVGLSCNPYNQFGCGLKWMLQQLHS